MKLSIAALPVGLALLSAVAARADTFELANGGQIEGTRLNTTENPPTKYVIKTSAGGEVTLKRDQVKEVRRPKPAELDYAKLRPQYADTVEGQWSLAEWCRERRLTEQRARHLERVLEFDPEHAKARQALGYAKVDGEWKTQDEIFQGRGMVKDKTGHYRVPQQIEEIERKRAHEKTVTEWFKKIKRWRGWLDTDRADEAHAQLQKIDDPEAVEPLYKQLKAEPVEAVRKIYVEALARIGTPEAWRALTVCSLDDADEEIRLSCLDYLEKQTGTEAVKIYIRRMKDKSANNTMIDREAVALGRMKDQSAVRPLIDSLITTHIIDLPSAGGNMNPTFGNGPGGGTFSFGGGQPKQEARQYQNQAVRDALASLTGQDFGYDQQSWRRWLSSQKRTQTVDARRD